MVVAAARPTGSRTGPAPTVRAHPLYAIGTDDKQYVATVSLQWMKGAHAMRFGYDYQNQQMNHFQPQGGTFQTVRGTFQFNGNATRLQNGPTPADLRFNSWADFLLGLPTQEVLP